MTSRHHAPATDPAMPWLDLALRPGAATSALGWSVPSLQGGSVHVAQTELLQHKPGRRAVVSYRLHRGGGAAPAGAVERVVGKTRARGLDVRTYRLQRRLAEEGFGPDDADGLRVPAPLGVVPGWRMWVQAHVDGPTVGELLAGNAPGDAVPLVRRVAALAGKLHRSDARTFRRHSVEDELRILAGWLDKATTRRPELTPRIDSVFRGCVQLARSLRTPASRGIHRDLHPGQIIMNDDQLYLLDLDLHAEGDPAVDYGNFSAHLTELSARTLGDPSAFAPLVAVVHDEAMRQDPAMDESHLRAWHVLSLARHIGLSTVLQGRGPSTDLILEATRELLARQGPRVAGRAAGRAAGPGAGNVTGLAAEPAAEPTPRASSGHRSAAVPQAPLRSLMSTLGAALVLGAASLLGAPTEGAAQHRVNVGLDVSSVYDSNVNRDAENPQGLAGVVTTGILRHRWTAGMDIRTEYEIGLHQYNADTPWNRVSHKLRLDGRRGAGSGGTLGLVSELQIRGSGEDRSLGDQLALEPSFRAEPFPGMELRIRGISRFRQNRGTAPGAPLERETNLMLGADVTQELNDLTEVEMDLRFERNHSENGRRDYQGPRGEINLTRALGESDEVTVGLGYRQRAYRERLVDTVDGEALRRDTRFTPVVRWEREVNGLLRLSLEYEYEARGSNDPDKNLGSHQLILGGQILR